jgi:hypothetical protein
MSDANRAAGPTIHFQSASVTINLTGDVRVTLEAWPANVRDDEKSPRVAVGSLHIDAEALEALKAALSQIEQLTQRRNISGKGQLTLP